MGTAGPKLRPDEWPTPMEAELENYRKDIEYNRLVMNRLLLATIILSVAAVVISIIAMSING